MAAQGSPPHRLALLIATSRYSDPSLTQLRAPGHDVRDLANVLRNPLIGGFSVQTLIDAPYGVLLEAIEGFCADRNLDDQLLIYLSCHGVLDDRGRLYYAATDTRRHRMAATAIGAAWLNERLEDSRARSQVVILDCCHSGAFARGAKGESDLNLKHRFESRGRGRIVLTASKATEYSFEGDQLSSAGVRSVFTRAMVDGLRTGDADSDHDGSITVSEIYQYTYAKVRELESRQTPELWTYGAEGGVIVARSIRGTMIKSIPLAEDLRLACESPRPRIRESAVAELAELLDTASAGLVLSARQALEGIGAKDIPQVASLARVALKASPGTAVRQVSAERAKREQPESASRQVVQSNDYRQALWTGIRRVATSWQFAVQSPSERRALGNLGNFSRQAHNKSFLEVESSGRKLRAGSSERITAALSYLILIVALVMVFRRNSFTRINAIQALIVDGLFLIPVFTIGPAYSKPRPNVTVAVVSQPWLGILDSIGVTAVIVWFPLIIFCVFKVIQGKLPTVVILTRAATRLSGSRTKTAVDQV